MKQPLCTGRDPVKRRIVPETGHVSDLVHTPQATAAHAAQDRTRRDPPGTTPLQGPERVQRRASRAPLHRQGPAARTMSPVPGRPPHALRSGPVNPGARAPWVREGTTATKKPTEARRAIGPDEGRHTNAGPQGTPDRHAAGPRQGTRTGAKQLRPPGAVSPRGAHNTRRNAAREQMAGKTGPLHPHTAPRARW